MAIHWQVKFRSLRANTLYTVNIYDDIYTGDPVQLTGADIPFETQEDDNEDWFLPVRTQSGYLRIFDTGKDNDGNVFDWRDMIPDSAQSRRVTLTDSSGVVHWDGYLQTQTFSGQIYEIKQEREYPVMCPLYSLRGIDMETAQNGIVNFAWLLRYILDKTGISFSSINFQGSNVIGWLRKRVDWQNFIDEDKDGVRTSKYDCFTILEEICKFWGWTCRTYRDQLFFVCPDDNLDPAFIAINNQDLYQLSIDEIPQYRTFDWESVDTDDDIYDSENNTTEILQGIAKATVTSDINKQDIIIDIPYDRIEEIYKDDDVADDRYGADGHIFSLHQFVVTSASYTFEDMIIDLRGWNVNLGASFLVQEYYEGDVTYKHNYNFNTVLEARGNLRLTSFADEALVNIKSRSPHNYDHGVFAISGIVSQVLIVDDTRQEYNAHGHLVCRLRIGDSWWNGNEWSYNKTTFNMPIGNEADGPGMGTGEIIDNRVLNGPYNAYKGYGCPIGRGIGGIVEFHIVGVALDDTHGLLQKVQISSLSMQFVRMKSYAQYIDRSENEYKATTDSNFSDEYNVETIFATNNGNAFGLGIIQNTDGTYCEEVEYSYSDGGRIDKPERHLLERIISRGRSIKKIHKIEVRSDTIGLSPYTYCVTSEMPAYPVSISRDWRNDRIIALLLETT